MCLDKICHALSSIHTVIVVRTLSSRADGGQAGVMIPLTFIVSLLLMGVFYVNLSDNRNRSSTACDYDLDALLSVCTCRGGDPVDCPSPLRMSIPLEDLAFSLGIVEGSPLSIVYATRDEDPKSFFIKMNCVEEEQATQEHSSTTDGSLNWLLCVDLHTCSRKALYLEVDDCDGDSQATTQEVHWPAGSPVKRARDSPCKPSTASNASNGTRSGGLSGAADRVSPHSSSSIEGEYGDTVVDAGGVPTEELDDGCEYMSSVFSPLSESDEEESPVVFADLYETPLHNEVYNFLKHNITPFKYRVFPAMSKKEKKTRISKAKAFRQNCRRRYALVQNNSGYTDLVRKRNTKEDRSRKDIRNNSVNASMRKKLYPLRVVLREKDIMPKIQADHTAHHDGHNKGEERLSRRYHIHNLREKYLSVCGENCAICSKFATIPKKPHRRICTDHFGELVMFDLTEYPIPDEEGRRWLLVVEDHFTKFTWVKAFHTKESKPIAEYLVKLFLDVSCVPERWHADNGGEFNSGYFDEARRILASNSDGDEILSYSHSLPRNPQCNGMVERRNRTVKVTSLKCMAEAGYIKDKDTTWDWFPVVLRIIRKANRAPVKMYGSSSSPYMLLHGRKPEAPDHAALEPDELRNLRNEAAQKQLKAAKGAALKADEWLFVFSVGDAVRVSAPNDKRKYTDKSGSGRAGWPAAGVIDRITSQGYYKILWTEGALNGDTEGTVSRRAYAGSRLKPDKTWHDHSTQNEQASENPPHHNVDDKQPDVDQTPSKPAFSRKRCRPQSKTRKQSLSMSQDFPVSPSASPRSEKKQRTDKSPSSAPKEKPRKNTHHCVPINRVGQFVSIPLQWFNKTAWSRRFSKGTFLVAVVVFSEPLLDHHHLLIIGDRTEGAFMAKEEVVLEWKETWLAHQEPKIPHYTIGFRTLFEHVCTYVAALAYSVFTLH